MSKSNAAIWRITYHCPGSGFHGERWAFAENAANFIARQLRRYGFEQVAIEAARSGAVAS